MPEKNTGFYIRWKDDFLLISTVKELSLKLLPLKSSSPAKTMLNVTFTPPLPGA